MGEGCTFDYNVTPDTTLFQLKQLLSEDLRDEFNDEALMNTILSQDGAPLFNESFTLDECNIQDKALLLLQSTDNGERTSRNLSLGLHFVDIATATMERRTWSESAPRWRVAGPGLCLEGVCKNKDCKAENKMVIVNIGYGDIDFLNVAAKKSYCPICSTRVKPVTCGFNNCRWKCKGTRELDDETIEDVLIPKSGGWKEADDAYHRFQADDTKDMLWLELKMRVKKLG